MSIVVYQDSVILSGDIVEDETSYKTSDAVAHKQSFPTAVLLPLSPPSEGRWGYVDGAFVDLDSIDAEVKRLFQESKARSDAVDAMRVRKIRATMLAESDWTQVADAPVDKNAWATYRQALRDIPEQSGFPTDVVWPDTP